MSMDEFYKNKSKSIYLRIIKNILLISLLITFIVLVLSVFFYIFYVGITTEANNPVFRGNVTIKSGEFHNVLFCRSNFSGSLDYWNVYFEIKSSSWDIVLEGYFQYLWWEYYYNRNNIVTEIKYVVTPENETMKIINSGQNDLGIYYNIKFVSEDTGKYIGYIPLPIVIILAIFIIVLLATIAFFVIKKKYFRSKKRTKIVDEEMAVFYL